jgi:hypothetical protein
MKTNSAPNESFYKVPLLRVNLFFYLSVSLKGRPRFKAKKAFKAQECEIKNGIRQKNLSWKIINQNKNDGNNEYMEYMYKTIFILN